MQRGLIPALASLSVLGTQAAAAWGFSLATNGNPLYTLIGPQGLPPLAGVTKDWATEALDTDFSQWHGDGWCLLDSGLVFQESASEELPWERPWVKALAQHPHRHRMAWVGNLETLSIIPLLQASGIPRYLNTSDILAPLLLTDWLGRFKNHDPCNAQALFPLSKTNTPSELTTTLRRWVVDGTAALELTITEILTQCEAWQTHAVNELHTCLQEALTNALYHAPVGDDGALKYEKHSVLAQIPTCDQLIVTLALIDGWVVINIADRWGRLTAERLLQGLFHQTTDAGLLDEDGRGMLLMHLLPQGWANFSVPNQHHRAVFIHPTLQHPPPDTHPARSFWFIEGA